MYVKVRFPSSNCEGTYRVPEMYQDVVKEGDFVITSMDMGSTSGEDWRRSADMSSLERKLASVGKVKLARVESVGRGDPPPSAKRSNQTFIKYFLALIKYTHLVASATANSTLQADLERRDKLVAQLDAKLAKDNEADKWRKYQALAIRDYEAASMLRELSSIKL